VGGTELYLIPLTNLLFALGWLIGTDGGREKGSILEVFCAVGKLVELKSGCVRIGSVGEHP
jgi:hypothetical protein